MKLLLELVPLRELKSKIAAKRTELEEEVATEKDLLKEAENKLAFSKQMRLQTIEETKQVKMDTKAQLAAAEEIREQAVKDALQARKNIEKAEDQQRVIIALLQTNSSNKKVTNKPNKVIFQDNLKDNSLGPKMVRIKKTNNFKIGNKNGTEKDEYPTKVSIKHFSMGKYELTVGEFKKFVQSTKYKTYAEKGNGCQIWTKNGWKKSKKSNWKKTGFSQNDEHPVTCINLYDATAYLKWLSKQTGKKYRLPTEAEWEYAARARTNTKYWWGNDIKKNKANCNGCNNKYNNKTVKVGSFVCNKFKLCDMTGNLWEWTCSEYDKKYRGKEKRCLKNVKNKKELVLRGGSWGSKPDWVYSTNRHFYNPDFTCNTIGFRVVREQ